ncbi:MAG: BglG family transcription antiterminator [Clostridiales bacterium]|nr:BglG family transcription antiterminator [Clostridiales bacterium]
MNKRTLSIVQKLSKEKKETSIAALAEEYEVSQRTIRNDLNAINDVLEENGLHKLELLRGGIVRQHEDFSQVLVYVMEGDFYQYKLSKEERKKMAAVFLVRSSEYITLSSIADSLFVIRATIIGDLDDIKEMIHKNGMEVISHPNKGLRVEGKESAKRLFIMKMSRTRGGATEQGIVEQHISVQAGNRIIIQKIVNEQEHVHKSFLTDASFRKILLYLGIMIDRNIQGEYVEKQDYVNNDKYRMAQDILKYISQYCHINTTESEVCFFSKQLQRAHYLKEKNVNNDIIKIQMITRQFIESISDELEINLNGDYDFFESLSNHLRSVFSDRPPSFQENPIIDEVLNENPEVLEAVKRRASIILKHMSRNMTEVEEGYIAVHICAALERKKNKEVAFHVIVACHAGIGTSHLLLEKLKKHFNFHIVDIVSSHEAAGIESGKADFIISTVPLPNCKIDYVVVSPLLNDEDYLRVGNKIDALRDSRNLPSCVEEKEISAKGVINCIDPIVHEMLPDGMMADALMKRIRKEVRYYMNQSVEADAEIFSPYLHHLLPASHITLDVECADWKDAVHKSAQKLLDSGYIEDRYIDAMIHNIEENGPYVVLSPGFAMPHEGLEEGSIKVGMSLIRLKNPVPFGEEEFDPVEFVCCLSAVDHKTHLKAFFNLVNMLQDGKVKDMLHNCKTSQEAASIIEKYEYEVVN